ncbi:MAG TPA: hypothetical protein VGX76_05295 [Pirellulales bacterium]|jgi:hypothetical protein|nr:hypothetical protein [Pirellulales bacterium]
MEIIYGAAAIVTAIAALFPILAKIFARANEIKAAAAHAATVAEAVHVLVNSNMGVQLKLCAVALRRVADLTNHPADDVTAKLAEAKLVDHESKQAAVDAYAVIRNPPPAKP